MGLQGRPSSQSTGGSQTQRLAASLGGALSPFKIVMGFIRKKHVFSLWYVICLCCITLGVHLAPRTLVASPSANNSQCLHCGHESRCCLLALAPSSHPESGPLSLTPGSPVVPVPSISF